MVWAVAERGSMRKGNKDGWSLDCSGWDEEDLRNGLQEVQISCPVTFSCGAGQRRRCTGQNLAQWNNWRTGFGTLSLTSDRLRKLLDAARPYIEF
jgi:hypothetical protein